MAIYTEYVQDDVFYQIDWITGQSVFCVVGEIPVVERSFMPVYHVVYAKIVGLFGTYYKRVVRIF